MNSIAPLTCVTRHLNKLLADWNNYSSRHLPGRMMDADSDKDKLKKLSDGIQNAVTVFLVSLLYRSSAYFK